ncbi:MAG: Hpt domain-containing protein [Cyanobacteria bacterium J06632_3]
MSRRRTASSINFDWQQLRQLAGEDASFATELLTLFMQDAESCLKDLEQAIATQNARSIEEAAHSLRGASANVGASALSAVAGRLEQSARRGDLRSAHVLLQQLKQHYRFIQAQFQL